MNKKAICALALTLSLSISSIVAAAATNKERIFGLNRYETSAAISEEGFTKGSEVVFIVSGENFPDALCTAPLAKKYNAPILLSGKNKLDPKVKERLQSLNAKKVFVIGGTGVISEDVVEEIQDLNIYPERIYGLNRYATSAKIADSMSTSNEIVVTTSSAFADALSIAPIAAMKSMPILLVNKDEIPKETKDFIKNHDISKVYLIGGPGVISDNVKGQLPNAERLYGNTRYETNINVINNFKEELDLSKLVIASGANFPDALSGSILAAVNKAPLMLLSEKPGNLTDEFINQNKDNIKDTLILGGTAVLSENALDYLWGNKQRPIEEVK